MNRRTKLLAYLSEAQNNRCAYCSVRTLLIQREKDDGIYVPSYYLDRRRFDFWRRATFDHFTPECFGGTNLHGNLIVGCLWCNQYRGNAPAELAFQRIQRLVKRGTHPHVVFQATGRFPLNFSFLPTKHRQAADAKVPA